MYYELRINLKCVTGDRHQFDTRLIVHYCERTFRELVTRVEENGVLIGLKLNVGSADETVANVAKLLYSKFPYSGEKIAVYKVDGENREWLGDIVNGDIRSTANG